MTKTTISQTADNEVTLTAIDPMTDEPITRVFWIPLSGGYVREGADHSGSDHQVCERLGRRGHTLTAENGPHLLQVIRREWKAHRRDAAKAWA